MVTAGRRLCADRPLPLLVPSPKDSVVVLMMWSAKGGAGVTACAVGAGVATARSGRPALLVDAVGDAAAVCGVAEPVNGMWDWVCSNPPADPDALARLEVPVCDGLSLVTAGTGSPAADPARCARLAQLLSVDSRFVLVDLGHLRSDREGRRAQLAEALREREATSLIVTRACYLALRAAAQDHRHADGMIVVREPGRSLGDHDLSAILGLPVAASVETSPAVSRSIDAGMLSTRAPREFLRGLAKVSR